MGEKCIAAAVASVCVLGKKKKGVFHCWAFFASNPNGLLGALHAS